MEPEGLSNFSLTMSSSCRSFSRRGHVSTWVAENDVENGMKMVWSKKKPGFNLLHGSEM
jgi:hypothetical protein